MQYDIDFLKQHIDYTLIGRGVSEEEMVSFCKQAIKYNVRTIYVPLVYVEPVVFFVKEHKIAVGTVAGFPLGALPIDFKETEIEFAAIAGASWIDVCLNLCPVRSQKPKKVINEVERLKKAAERNDIGLKLIIETPYLDEAQIRQVTKIISNAEIDFLKTATGFGNEVSADEVMIIKPILTETKTKLKVAGGIKTLEQAKRFFQLGADIIGSSNGFAILEQAKKTG